MVHVSKLLSLAELESWRARYEISCKLNETLSLHYLTAILQLNGVFWRKQEDRCGRILDWVLPSLLLSSRDQLQTEWNIIITLFNGDTSTERCILKETGEQMWPKVGLRSSLIWNFAQHRLVVICRRLNTTCRYHH